MRDKGFRDMETSLAFTEQGDFSVQSCSFLPPSCGSAVFICRRWGASPALPGWMSFSPGQTREEIILVVQRVSQEQTGGLAG